MDHTIYLECAIKLARKSFQFGGFPAGAVIVKDGAIISEGLSIGLLENDPVEHAEITAIKKACSSLRTPWIKNTILYTSMEPCLMCLGACLWANITDVYFTVKKESMGTSAYLGAYDNNQIATTFSRNVNLHHIDMSFENELSTMIKTWETNTFT